MQAFFLKYWIFLLICLCALLAGFAAGSLMSSARSTKAALDAQAIQFAADRKADQDAASRNLLAAFEANTADNKADTAIAAFVRNSNELLKKVNNAPNSSNCVDSPVARAYYDGLRELQATANKVRLPGNP